MTTQTKRGLAHLFILAGALLCPGCFWLMAGAGAGAAGVRELTDSAVNYSGTVDQAEQAVRKTFKDIGATVTETVRDETTQNRRTLRGVTFDNEAVTVDLEPVTTRTITVEIRVGRIGDKARADEIHAKLKKYLKPLGSG